MPPSASPPPFNIPTGGQTLALLPVLAEAIDRVQREFEQALRSDLPPVQRLVEHLENYRGKMLRPALVILSGLAATPPLAESSTSPSHITIAAAIEMIHMATLVHDDVLDEALDGGQVGAEGLLELALDAVDGIGEDGEEGKGLAAGWDVEGWGRCGRGHGEP